MSFQRLGTLCQFAIELFSFYDGCAVFEIDSWGYWYPLYAAAFATRATKQTMQEEANDEQQMLLVVLN
jgi:hypothetical protein